MNLEFKPYVRLAMYHTWLYDYVIDRVIFDHEIIYIDKINDEYEVKLSNGTYIDFDKNGNWNYISSDDTITDSILPKSISNKVKNIIKNIKMFIYMK